MTVVSPRVASIDPDELVLPEGLTPTGGGEGEVVVVLAEEGARSSGWTSQLAVTLASEWANGGHRIVLCDGDLRNAPLHRELGCENGEGIADVISFGASPRRVAQTLDSQEFVFIPTGTIVADAGQIFLHARWRSLYTAFRQSGTCLVLYLPAEPRGVSELAEAADRVVRLATFRPPRDPDDRTFVLHVRRSGHDAAFEADRVPEDDTSAAADVSTDPALDASAEPAADASTEPALDAVDPDREPDRARADEGIRPDGDSDVEDGQRPPEPTVPRPSESSRIEVVTDEISEPWSESPSRAALEPQREQPSAATRGPSEKTTKSTDEAAGPSGEAVDPNGEAPVLEESSAVVGTASSPERKRRPRVPWILLALLIVVAAVLVSGWLGVITIPGLTPVSPAG